MQKSELVSARLSPKEIDEIERLVGDGFYMNTADFVRMAVREKLESIKVIDIRNVTKEKAMKEVIASFTTCRIASLRRFGIRCFY